MTQTLLASLFMAASTWPVMAQDGIWWCEVEGTERMNYDAYGLAFNDHTLCRTETRINLIVATDDAWSGAVMCENIYVTDQDATGVLQNHTIPLDAPTWLSLTGAVDGTLYLRNSPDGPERTFLPC